MQRRKLSERSRPALTYARLATLAVIMAATAVVVVGAALAIVYRATFEEQRSRLVEIAHYQGNLIAAVARHDATVARAMGVPELAYGQTVAQIMAAHARGTSDRPVTDIAIGRRDGDYIAMLVSEGRSHLGDPILIPWENGVGEPMRRALHGETGTIIGPDYRKVQVLAAYYWVPELSLGVVAKINITDIRAPFFRASALAAVIGIVLIGGGATIFVVGATPLMRKVRHDEALFEGVVEGSSDAIFVKDRNNRFLFINRAGAAFLGTTPEHAIGRTEPEVMPAHSAEKAAAIADTVMTEERIMTVEVDMEMGGGFHTFQVVTGPFRLAPGQVDGTIGIARDVTELKRQRQELDRANRSLALLNRINRALVHTTSEDRLIHKICRILVENGGYRLAWIAYLEDRQPRSVDIAARHGEDRGYLSSIALGWNDEGLTLDGCPIEAKGLRKDGTSMEPHQADPDCTCVQKAADFGLASTATLPLVVRGRVFGTLVLHAGEADAFDGIAFELLGELADDLAFGIMAARESRAREQAERDLYESEARFRALTENSTDIVTVLDGQGVVRYQSPSLKSILGFAPDEMIDHVAFDFVHPDDKDGAMAVFAELLSAPDATRDVRFRHRHRDGGWRWMHTFVRNLLNDPVIRGIVANSRDVTDIHDSNQALAIVEQRFYSIVQDHPDLICLFTPDCLLTFVNTAYARTFRRTAGQLIGTSFLDLIPLEAREEARGKIATLTPGKPTQSYEHPVIGPDGEVRWQAWTDRAFFDENGKMTEVQSAGYDITDRKRAELALIESEQRFRTVTDAAQDAIIAIDERGTITAWNRGAETIFGLSEGQALGRTALTLIAAKDRNNFADALTMAITGVGEESIQEFAGINAHEEEIPIEISFGTWRSENQLQISAIIRDISERKATEARIWQAQKAESLGNLAAGIAHDFNNMLLPILGLSELTRDELPEGSRGRTRLDKVIEASVRARELVARILAFTRAEDDFSRHEPIDLAQAVHTAVELIKATLPSTIELRTRIPRTPLVVAANRTEIQAMLMNLTSNAADAIEGKPGRIDIRLGRKQDMDGDRLNQALLTIADTGHGMDEKVLARAFDPYFTTKGVGAGTGLGLPIIQGIVTKHKGTIQVESEPGHGTMIEIRLPLASQEDPPTRA